MLKKGEVHPDKLLWHVFSEGAPELGEEFDIAASYLEGGSTYYVADRVRAAKKYAFVHIDYPSSGYTRELDRGCYGAFDRIFAVSEETRESFLRVYPEYGEKTLVFPNPIDREGILGRSEAPGGFEDGFGGFRLLTVGRLSRQKAYDVAVEAMAVLKQRGLPMRWYVLGEGEQRRALERKIARLGLERDFVLLGAVENPFPYYRQADIYVHATRYEGKSIAVQEAQILGCAVVVSDCCGNREQVTDGVDGLLCKLEPRDIADSIERLYRDVELRQRLSLAAERKAEGLSEDDGLLAWFC